MSVESLKAFGNKITEDEDLKKKAQDRGLDNVDEMVALAQENGFDVTREDYKKLAEEVKSSEELTDDDLEQVAGGLATTLAAGAAVGAAAGGALVAGGAVAAANAGKGW